MSRTSTDAPKTAQSTGLLPRIVASPNVVTIAPAAGYSRGYARTRRADTALSSAAARSGVTRGRSRANMRRCRHVRQAYGSDES